LPKAFTAASRSWPRPDGVLVANVAGDRMREAAERWSRDLWALEAEMAKVADHCCGVTCGYDHPTQLGVDRWVAVIAARARHQGAVCVVDFGTAVTVDAVSRQGRHLGGVIFPGIRLMRQSLAGRTGNLPEVDSPAGDELLGRSTRQCILSGTLHAVSIAVNGFRSHVEARLGETARFYLTGGDAARVGPLLHGEYAYVPELVLDGLEVLQARE